MRIPVGAAHPLETAQLLIRVMLIDILLLVILLLLLSRLLFRLLAEDAVLASVTTTFGRGSPFEATSSSLAFLSRGDS